MCATEILHAGAECIADRGKQRDQQNGERSMGRAVAAFNAPESNADYSHEREISAFNLAVRGLTNNLRIAA